jgi:metal-sulfur cluster biosynthetic enzyme
MKDQVIAALKNVFDPEIPVNIWDLGLIYDIKVQNRKSKAKSQTTSDFGLWTIDLKMTMTSPTCPMADDIMENARAEIAKIPGVDEIKIDLVWDPAWSLSKMSDAAKIELDLTEMGW